MTSFTTLHDIMAKRYADSPQKFYTVKAALDTIEENLRVLHRNGHMFELHEPESPQGVEYPKMLYHPDGRQITVDSKEAEDGLTEGWALHWSLDEESKKKATEEAAERAKLVEPSGGGTPGVHNAPIPPARLGIGEDGKPAIVSNDAPQPIVAPRDPEHWKETEVEQEAPVQVQDE